MGFLVRPLVLRSDASADLLLEMAQTVNWEFVHDNSSFMAAEHVRETVWQVRTFSIHLISEMATRTHSVAISGTGEAGALRKFLVGVLDPFSPDELVEQVTSAGSEAEVAVGLVRLGMGAPLVFDPVVFELIERGFGHRHHGVRSAALWASSFVLWPELLPLIDNMRRTDPDELLREAAADTLALHRAAEADA